MISYQHQYMNEQQRYIEMVECYRWCLVNENIADADLIFERIKKQDKIVKDLQLRLTLINI